MFKIFQTAIIIVIFVLREITSDLLPNSQDYTGVPAPLRYWNANVTLDSSTKDTKIPYFAKLRYLELMPEETLAKHLAGAKRSCFYEEGSSKDVDESVPGVYKHFIFKSPEITKYKVVQFDETARTAHVEFHSTWQTFEVVNDVVNETATTLDEFVRGVKANSLYNVSFLSPVTPSSPNSCPNVEYFPVPDNWCDHGSVFYGGKVIQASRSKLDNRCSILFSDQVEHYINTWRQTETIQTDMRKCIDIINPNFDFNTEYTGSSYEADYPDFYPCHKTHNGANSIDPPCYDPRYSLVEFVQNGIGEIVKLDVGRNPSTTDINVTVEFTRWTADFVRQFSYAFRDCDYNIGSTELEIHIFIPDIVVITERSAPWYLFIMIIVIAFPMFVMLLALFLLCFTRTRKVFRLDLWEWWKQKFAEKEQDPEQVSELSYADSNSDGEKKETENFGF